MMDVAEASLKWDNLHTCDSTQAGINITLCVCVFLFFLLITALESSLCLFSCLWFSQDQNCTVLSSAWPSVAMATQGSWDWWRVRKAWHRLNQKNYLFASRCCLTLITVRLCASCCVKRRLVTLCGTCWPVHLLEHQNNSDWALKESLVQKLICTSTRRNSLNLPPLKKTI